MIFIKNKHNQIFSIKKIKDNPFSGLDELVIHKNKNILLLKERKIEWASEYFLIYNSDNLDQN